MNTKPRVTLKISPCECRCPLPTRLRHTRDAPRSGSRLITCARVGFTSTAGPLQPAAADQRVCTSAGSLVAAAAFQLRCAPGQIPPVAVPAATAFTPRCYSLTPCRSPTSLDCGTQYTPTSTTCFWLERTACRLTHPAVTPHGLFPQGDTLHAAASRPHTRKGARYENAEPQHTDTQWHSAHP